MLQLILLKKIKQLVDIKNMNLSQYLGCVMHDVSVFFQRLVEALEGNTVERQFHYDGDVKALTSLLTYSNGKAGYGFSGRKQCPFSQSSLILTNPPLSFSVLITAFIGELNLSHSFSQPSPNQTMNGTNLCCSICGLEPPL